MSPLVRLLDAVFGMFSICLIRRPASDEDILKAVGPWMLYCAVCAYKNTLSTSGNLDFDAWFMCCTNTWVREVQQKLGASQLRIKYVVRDYAKRNSVRSQEDINQSVLNGNLLTWIRQ